MMWREEVRDRDPVIESFSYRGVCASKGPKNGITHNHAGLISTSGEHGGGGRMALSGISRNNDLPTPVEALALGLLQLLKSRS